MSTVGVDATTEPQTGLTMVRELRFRLEPVVKWICRGSGEIDLGVKVDLIAAGAVDLIVKWT